MKLHADHLLDRLKRGGVLLTTKAENKINTMTIGWGSISEYWGKEVFIVPVRHSRYTHDLLEKSQAFTVSVPRYNELAKQIAYCGSNSGRDVDKFKECDLKTANSKYVDSPIIDIPGYHFECKIVYKTAMDPKFLDSTYDETLYSDKDYHTLYFGEIKACYKTE